VAVGLRGARQPIGCASLFRYLANRRTAASSTAACYMRSMQTRTLQTSVPYVIQWAQLETPRTARYCDSRGGGQIIVDEALAWAPQRVGPPAPSFAVGGPFRSHYEVISQYASCCQPRSGLLFAVEPGCSLSLLSSDVPPPGYGEAGRPKIRRHRVGDQAPRWRVTLVAAISVSIP
jgi:hypothetical protein